MWYQSSALRSSGDSPACDADRHRPHPRRAKVYHERSNDALGWDFGSNAPWKLGSRDSSGFDDVRSGYHLGISCNVLQRNPTADEGYGFSERKKRRDSRSLRNSHSLYPATIPVRDRAAATRDQRRSLRSDKPTRAVFPESTKESPLHSWTAHPYSTHVPANHSRDHGNLYLEANSYFHCFDGNSYDEEYLDWELMVDEFFYYNDIPLKIQARIVSSKLIGRAKIWWKHIKRARRIQGRKDIQTWTKMKRFLRSQFLLSYRDEFACLSVEKSSPRVCENNSVTSQFSSCVKKKLFKDLDNTLDMLKSPHVGSSDVELHFSKNKSSVTESEAVGFGVVDASEHHVCLGDGLVEDENQISDVNEEGMVGIEEDFTILLHGEVTENERLERTCGDLTQQIDASAIEFKSHNALPGELVAFEVGKSYAENKKLCDNDSVDFVVATTAALGAPSPSLLRDISFEYCDDSLSVDQRKGKGDVEEEELMRILNLSSVEISSPASDAISVFPHSPDGTTPFAFVTDNMDDSENFQSPLERKALLDVFENPSSLAIGEPIYEGFEGKDALSYANILRTRNKYGDAHILHNIVLEKENCNLEALAGREICLQMLNLNRQAFETFMEVIKLDPQLACARTHYRVLYKAEGRLCEAAEPYQMSRELSWESSQHFGDILSQFSVNLAWPKNLTELPSHMQRACIAHRGALTPLYDYFPQLRNSFTNDLITETLDEYSSKRKYSTLISLSGHLFDQFLITEAVDIVEALLFDELEISDGSFIDDSKSPFDSIDDALTEMKKWHFSCTPWVSSIKPSIWSVPKHEYFMKEASRRMKWDVNVQFPSTLQQAVEKDLDSAAWFDVQFEAENTVCEKGDTMRPPPWPSFAS